MVAICYQNGKVNKIQTGIRIIAFLLLITVASEFWELLIAAVATKHEQIDVKIGILGFRN